MQQATNTPIAQLQAGQRVYCMLYGGTYGVVVAIEGAQQPGSIVDMGGITMGGNARMDVVWDDGSTSKSVPECIVRGVQWEIFPEVFGPEVIADYLARAATYKAKKAADADASKAAQAKADAEALVAGQALGLIPEAEFLAAGKRGTAAAHNLRIELKKAGIKASVKGDYNSITVSITDNAHKDAAKALMAKYKAGNFDSMSDCYEFNAGAWGRVFGDVRYVFGRSAEGYCF